jgi:hypothetical protein
VATAIGFTACGSDDDGDLGGASISETPAYESDAAKYDITSSGNYSTIELTASGNYIIKLKGTRATAPKNLNPYLLGHAKAAETRSGYSSGIYYGNFTKDGNQYILDGFGTLVVNQEAGSNVSLQLTPEGGSTAVLTGTKAATIVSSSLTDKLCRTWTCVKFTALYRDKTTGQEQNLSYTMSEAGVVENIVILTKSGTYFGAYSYKGSDSTIYSEYSCGTWAWIDESTGRVRFDDCGDEEPDYVDEHYFTFSGNTLVARTINESSSLYTDGSLYYVAY